MSWIDNDSYDEWEDNWLDHIPPRHRAKLTRSANKQKRPKVTINRDLEEMIASLAEENDLVSSFETTYTRNMDEKHHERRWLLEALSGFYHDQMISDVLHIVKGGKEANVYCCDAHPLTGLPHIAAKVYRPRMLRHLKNDSLYKEGRFVLNQEGKQVKGNRSVRAMRKKTGFGQKLDFATWIMHEYKVHNQLYQAGVDVPKPIANGVDTILMAYIGEPHYPARTLSDTSITSAEAPLLFERILENIRLMLTLNLIHGDLSAYNILYWQGNIFIIDFPQVVDARKNRSAFTIFERDVVRVCQYFHNFGVEADGRTIAAEMYQRYLDAEL